MRAIKLKNSRGEKAAKSIAHLLCNVETGKTLSQLLLCVPRREEIYGAWEKCSFDNSKEGPDDEKLLVRLHCRCGS